MLDLIRRFHRDDSGQIDFGIGDAAGSITAYLDAFLADLVSALYYAVVYAFQLLDFLWNVLVAMATWIYNILQGALQWVETVSKWIWQNVLKNIVTWIQRLRAELHKIFAPVLDVLRKIKALQDWYYQNVLKPVMVFLQRLRGVLLIFRLLHFRFAQQLDSYLSKQEGKLAQAFLVVTQQLNQLIGWVNWLSDPFGLISTNVYLWTAARSINDLWAMLHDIQDGHLGQAQKLTDSQDAAFFTKGNLQTVLSRPAGSPLTQMEQDEQDAVRQAFIDMGYSLT